jgi:hypothetical protein
MFTSLMENNLKPVILYDFLTNLSICAVKTP